MYTLNSMVVIGIEYKARSVPCIQKYSFLLIQNIHFFSSKSGPPQSTSLIDLSQELLTLSNHEEDTWQGCGPWPRHWLLLKWSEHVSNGYWGEEFSFQG